MMDSVIKMVRLSRYFGTKCVVRDLNLAVTRGQVTALLGLNGAGKSTTIRIIMGLLRPTRGRCEVLGEDTSTMPPETRSRIGYTVEGHFMYPSLTVAQCADFQRASYEHWDDRLFGEIVSHFRIQPSSYIGELSRGQRAGVSLAQALAPDPELLVLDDPALGLDPISRRALNETIIEFAGSGQRSVLLSTHLLDDVERIADRVTLLVDGHLKVDAAMDEFQRRVTGIVAKCEHLGPEQLSQIPRLIDSRQLGGRLTLIVADADEQTRAAVESVGAQSATTEPLTFADAVLAYLARERGDASFLNQGR